MEVREALRKWLLASPNVQTLTDSRVYVNRLPKGSPHPQITIAMVSGPKVRDLRGPDGLVYPRVQIDCWARTAEEVTRLANAVRLSDGGLAANGRLDGFVGILGGPGGITVQNVNFEDERDNFFPPQDASDVGVHNVSLDVIIWWEEG